MTDEHPGTTATGTTGLLAGITRPTGTIAMVAMDQRESLRAMLRDNGQPGDDATMVGFKLAVARHLAPLASGFLIDRHYGYNRITGDLPLPAGCGLLLAADELTQPAGGPVLDTAIDEAVDPPAARAAGVVGLKLLVMWKRDGGQDRRVAMAAEFIRRCAGAGLASVLEPVAVAAPGEADFDLDASILDAASALAHLGPTLYKAQVPARGRLDLPDLVRAAEKLDRAIGRPWVVLSNGVAAADFPRGVEAACRGGASGMLAGRALWADALATADPAAAVREESTRRLRELVAIIDRYARPAVPR